MEKLISQLFGKHWNYTWENVDNHLIGRYYSQGGFKGLLEILEAKKESSANYDSYYSSNLIPTLQTLVEKEATDEDFEQYIVSNVKFNKTNFEKLKEFGRLDIYKDFDTNFRGTIVKLHTIGDYLFIETLLKGKSFYYEIRETIGHCFNSLDRALIYSIFRGEYQDTLNTLYNSSHELKF